jgi:hypothetical protein
LRTINSGGFFMFFGYTISELMIFGLAGIVALWSIFNIIAGQRYSASKFFYYFVLAATGFGLWAWRSGTGEAFYLTIKRIIGTP